MHSVRLAKRPARLTRRQAVPRHESSVLRLLCAVFATAYLTATPLPATATEQRVALVIGNGAYAQSPLPNTINDARGMTDVLGKLGFKVITRLNATQQDMHRAIVEFGDEIEKGGVGLFYYAGHAVQIRGKNFMIPVKAAISVEDHVEPESVDLNKVIGRMAGARNKLNIVILDACRDNPFGDTFRFYAEGLAQTRAPAGTYIAYAAAPGEVAADGTGANSFYTGALIRTMQQQGLSIEETFKRVRTAVLDDTKGQQVPWTASSITEDFFFNPALPKATEKDKTGADKAVDREVVFWQSILSSSRPEDFEAYLDQFPSGNFAPLARNRLAELRPRKDAPNAGKRAQSTPSLRAATDPALLEAIDRAMANAKGDGADYLNQIQAAVEALNKLRSQQEDVSRKAETAREQVVAAVTETADKRYPDERARARRAAEAAEETALADAAKTAESEREKALTAAAEGAKAASAAAYAKMEKQADERTKGQLAQAQKRAEEDRKRELALVNEKAYEAHRKAMAEAEKAAEAMRQRMIAAARDKADGQLQETISEADRAAEEKAAEALAKARTDAEAKKAKELTALESSLKTEEARMMAAGKRAADRKFEEAVSSARAKAAEERKRLLADAKKAAEAARRSQIATLAPLPAAKAAAERAPTPAELGIGTNVSPTLKRAIDSAVSDARKKGEGRDGQMRAALAAIKTYRGSEPSSTKGKGASGRPAVAALDATVSKPELKEIIEIAMQNARTEGKNYQGQVQAALDAVKLYRDRETQGGVSHETDKSQTSALLLGQSQADPDLQRVIDDAMTQSHAKGEDYAGQVRAALAAIKAYRARTVR